MRATPPTDRRAGAVAALGPGSSEWRSVRAGEPDRVSSAPPRTGRGRPALTDPEGMKYPLMTNRLPFFDAHFHVIDSRFPLFENNGFLPEEFTVEQYRDRTSAL